MQSKVCIGIVDREKGRSVPGNFSAVSDEASALIPIKPNGPEPLWLQLRSVICHGVVRAKAIDQQIPIWLTVSEVCEVQPVPSGFYLSPRQHALPFLPPQGGLGAPGGGRAAEETDGSEDQQHAQDAEGPVHGPGKAQLLHFPASRFAAAH